jgi:hypothetical protein
MCDGADWAITPRPMKPVYALGHQRENDRYLRTLERCLRDRMVAGRMAIGFLKEGDRRGSRRYQAPLHQ